MTYPARPHELLRRWRHESGMSVRDLADRAGLSRSAVSAYETGRCRPSTRALESLGNALDLRQPQREALLASGSVDHST